MTSLVLDVIYRDHGAQKGMAALGNQVEKNSQSFSKFKTAATIGIIAAGAAVVKFGVGSVKAYSDAQEAQKSLAFAFQKFPALADTNQAALQKLNSALQLKTKYDDDNIASGQAVLAQFKLTGSQITRVTPLLLDYADKTGKDIPAAAKDVGKALLGNAKALKNIGISYKSTGNTTTDFTNITALMQQKIGGFAENEGKTAAGQLAILKNQFGELEETVGSKLLPALSGGLKVLNDLTVGIGQNADVIIPLVGGVAGLAGTIWLAQKAQVAWNVASGLNKGLATAAVKGLNVLKVAFTGVEITSTAAGRAMRIAQLSIPVVGIALFAVTTAMAAFAAKGGEATTAATDYSSAMESVAGGVTLATAALNKNVRETAVKALQDKGAFDAASKLRLSYSTVTDAVLGNKAAIAEVNAVLGPNIGLNRASSKSNADLQSAAQLLANTMGDEANSAKDAARNEAIRRMAMKQSAAPTETLAHATKGLKDANKELSRELQKSIDKLTILKNGALDQEEANQAWQGSLDDLRKSVKENGKSLDVHTEKGRNNRKAIVASMHALDDKTKADYKSAGQQKNSAKAVADANKRYQDNKRDLEKAAVAAGYSSGEVKKMIRQYLKTPKQLKTQVDADTKKAAQKVRDQQGRIRDLQRMKVNTVANLTFKNNAGKIVANLNKSFQLVKGGPHMKLATGGVLPGYTPGRDVHRFHSATGGVLDLSGGEAIMRPEWTKRVGGPKAVARMNRAARSGFAYGGVYSAEVNANSREGGSGSQMYGWGVKKKLEGAMAYAKAHGGGAGGLGDPAHVSNPRGVTSYHGGRFTRLFVANLKAAERSVGKAYSIYQGGFRPTTSYSGSTHNMDAIDAHVNYTLLRAFRKHVGAMGDRTGLGHWASHMHGVPAPGHGYGSPSARAQYRDYVRRGGAKQGMRSPWGLEQGGVATDAGLYRIAEKRPERVLSSRQTQSYERLGRALESTGGAVTVNITVDAPNFVGSSQDLVRALTKAEQSGQLDALKRRFK
jgi:hypothetical protein